MSICSCCDQFIISTEPIILTSKEILLKNCHRLGVKEFEKFHVTTLHPILTEQYQVKDVELHEVLLSPRACHYNDKYETFKSCHNSLKGSCNQKRKNAPKYSITNGFMFEYIPSSVLKIGNMTDLLTESLSIQRPYGYISLWIGGAHQAIQGRVVF